jgi:hypothetical protein
VETEPRYEHWEKYIPWVIHELSAISCIIPLRIGYRKYRQLNRGLQLLVINLFIALIVEILAFSLSVEHVVLLLGLTAKENFFVLSLYAPIEFVLYVLMFKHWSRSQSFRKFLTASIPVFLLIWISGVVWSLITSEMAGMEYMDVVKTNMWTFENYLLSAVSVFFIICAITMLFVWLRDESSPLMMNGMFWVTAAVLVYFSGNLFVFTFFHLILEKMSEAWYIHTALNLLKNLLFAYGLTLAGKSVVRVPATSDT